MLPDNPNLRGDLTRIYYTLADCLNRCNRREEAREMDERALVLARGVAGDLDDSRGQRLLAGVLEASGYRMARWDDPAGGEERLRKALEIQERLFSQEEPRISKGSLARTLDHLATACDMQGRSGEAEKMYRRAIAIRRELAESRPDNAGIHCDLGAVLHNLAFCLSRRGELEAACDLLEEAIEVQLAALDSEPDLKSASRYLAKHCRFLGGYRLRLGDVEEAASVVETVVQLEIRDARLHYALAVVLVGCASASGDAKRKEDFLDRAVRCFMKAVDLGFRDTNLIKKDRRIWVHLRGREEFQRLMKPLR